MTFRWPSENIAVAPLGEVTWLFVMSPNHPLSQQTAPLSEAQLRRYPAVNIEDSARRLTKRVVWRLPGQKEIVVPDIETKVAAHIAGVGIGFLPEPLCQPLIARGELVSRQIPTMRPPSPLSLAWRKDHHGKAVQDITSLFGHSAPEIQGFLTLFSDTP